MYFSNRPSQLVHMTRSSEVTFLFKSILTRITERVFRLNFFALFLFLLLFSFLQNGIWFIHVAERLLLAAQDIYSNPLSAQINQQWILHSYLGPVIAYLTGLNNSLLQYCLLHLFIFLFFFTALLLFIRLRMEEFIARTVLIIFFLTPLPNILFTWLGYPDVFTVLLSMCLVLFKSRNLVLIPVCFLMGVNHSDQGIVIVVLISVFLLVSHGKKELWRNLQFFLCSSIGVGMGRLSLEWWFSHNEFNIQHTRELIPFQIGIAGYLKINFSNLPAFIFSTYNVLWIFLIVWVAYFYRTREAKAFLLCNLFTYLVVIIAIDQTRDFALLSFPCVLLLVLSEKFRNLADIEKEFFKKVLVLALVIGLFVPRIIVWDGNIYSSTIFRTVEYTLIKAGILEKDTQKLKKPLHIQ